MIKSETQTTFSLLYIPYMLSLKDADSLTHSQRDATSSQDFMESFSNSFASVLQVIHIDIDIPNISHYQWFIRCCPCATVVCPEHGRLGSDLAWTKSKEVEKDIKEGVGESSLLV